MRNTHYVLPSASSCLLNFTLHW